MRCAQHEYLTLLRSERLFLPKAQPTATLPDGVLFGSLKEMAEAHPELIKKYYGKLADTSQDAIAAFNTMFAQDGVCMYVPKGTVIDKPIQLVNILRADTNTMVNRRILIILEEGAQAKLLICDHAIDEVNFLSTQVIEVFAHDNTVFDLYELEETHNSTIRFNNLYVHQEANSNVLLNGMTLHNGTTRNTTSVTLAGKGAEVNLCGVAIADKTNKSIIIRSSTTKFQTVPATNSSNTYSMTKQSEHLPVEFW